VTEVFLNLTKVFLTLTEVFPCFFLSCKANAKVKLAKTGHGPHYTTLVCICVVRLLFVFYVVFVCKCVLPPGHNPTAVNKYIIISYINRIHANCFDTIVSSSGVWANSHYYLSIAETISPSHSMILILL
jgi:hypothetical protein